LLLEYETAGNACTGDTYVVALVPGDTLMEIWANADAFAAKLSMLGVPTTKNDLSVVAELSIT
jgi:hypothetical protein